MDIKHDILPKQKPRKRNKQEIIDIFPLAESLISELEQFSAFDRMKTVKQLGSIRVKKQLEKSRYDYVMLQLYFHQLIRKNLQSRLKYSYNNRISRKDFLYENILSKDFDLNDTTMADIIQILIIIYNVGHFYNTFISSQALIMLSSEDDSFFEFITNSFSSERHREVCSRALKGHNYQRIHLLNSLLLLEKCDSSKVAVQLAEELVLAYLEENSLPVESKLHDYFQLFRNVRKVAYVAYDLQIADIPFTIDLLNKPGLINFFDEYLAEFNNGINADHFVNAMSSMLNAAVYNKVDEVICNTQISKMMVRKLKNNHSWENYFEQYWQNPVGIFNQRYPHQCNYEQDCLKLTIEAEHLASAEKLYRRLDHQSSIRVGYYLRHSGEMTIVSSINKTCSDKPLAAFKLLQTMVSHLRMLKLKADDSRYILVVKYFLFYLFNKHNLKIIPVVHESRCVICTRGKNSRISESLKCITMGNEGQQHEVRAMIKYLKTDEINDIAIVVAGSTVVYSSKGETIAEFDGIIIYPNRKQDQVILFEAKNIRSARAVGIKFLKRRLNKLGIQYDEDKVCRQDNDAYVKLTF